MLVVVARERDEAARRLVRRWGAHDARLLTVRDLSRPGWLVGDVEPSQARAVVDGGRVPVADIQGVLTTFPWVSSADLEHVDRRDRDYCAAEMTAFLAWWISSLPCPVVNRPTAACLNGPGWRAVTWSMVAAAAGLPSRWNRSSGRAAMQAGRPPPAATTDVPVVGGRCLSTCPPDVAARAVSLARAARTEALTVRLCLADGIEFLGAEPTVDLAAAECADAVLATLCGPRRPSAAQGRTR